jgi:S1-C subfamily serine protease
MPAWSAPSPTATWRCCASRRRRTSCRRSRWAAAASCWWASAWYAIGNPFGLDQTLTTGIVSALNREIESFNNRTIRGVIQTDAAINPGNSGGPLLDSAGRLIGVNTQIASPSGASAGIGFAIPVDEVNRIVPRLIRDGRFVRPAIGVTAASDALQRALDLPKGVPLVQVQPGSPAARAGLQPFRRGSRGEVVQGDVITAVNDEPVSSLDDMLAVLERRQPGDSVTLTVWRAGQTRRQAVVLAGPAAATNPHHDITRKVSHDPPPPAALAVRPGPGFHGRQRPGRLRAHAGRQAGAQRG